MVATSRVAIFWLAALLFYSLAIAQGSNVAGLDAVPNLAHLTRSSGMIFRGTVTSVAKPETLSDVPAVQITFRVEEGILGVRSGQSLTIREWAGLWDAGERYRAGERVMLFLYPPSRLGLTSPVGGPQGRFNIDRSGQIVLSPATGTPLRSSPVATVRPTTRTSISTRNLVQAIRQLGRE